MPIDGEGREKNERDRKMKVRRERILASPSNTMIFHHLLGRGDVLLLRLVLRHPLLCVPGRPLGCSLSQCQTVFMAGLLQFTTHESRFGSKSQFVDES